MIGPLGEWVMRTAMRQLNVWELEGHAPPRVALNISSVQVKMPDFVEGVRRILVETGADARRFDLELTEGILRSARPRRFQRSRSSNRSVSNWRSTISAPATPLFNTCGISRSTRSRSIGFSCASWWKIERRRDHPRYHVAGPQPQAWTGRRGNRDRRAARYPARAGLHDRPGLFLQPAARGGRLRLDDRARECAADQPGKQTKSRCRKARRPR